MFGIFNRQKRTLVEKIVDSARKRIVKKRDYHKAETDRLAAIIRGHLDAMHFHKETFQALDRTLARIDNPPTAPTRIEFAADDFDNGNIYDNPHNSEDALTFDDEVFADMGDGRSATVSDTLDKINAAAAEIAARGPFEPGPAELPIAPPLDVPATPPWAVAPLPAPTPEQAAQQFPKPRAKKSRPTKREAQLVNRARA